MKYYNIDLTQFVPYGISLNSTDMVEYKNHINEFFLRGFEKWYNQLFTVKDGNLVRDYARSCAAPHSLSACKYCTDAELERYIQDEGFVYYPENDHDINAKFVYDLTTYQRRTKDYLRSIAQYISNNINVDIELLYDNCPEYEYNLRLHGDIVGSTDISVMIARLLNHLTVLSTAHTKLKGIEFVETSPEIDTFAACVGDNSCIYYESIIEEVKPKPSLDTFDPEMPFCIENIGDVPVEIGLYNRDVDVTTAVRKDCKISYDLNTWQDYVLALAANAESKSINKITLAKKGDRVYFKATFSGMPANSTAPYTHFIVLNESANTKIRAGGNITSLTFGAADAYKTEYHYISTAYCYQYMFKGCKSLVQLTELPATTLSSSCYEGMFLDCSNLIKTPNLPGMTLAHYCYRTMFRGCTSLSQTSSLPAMVLADSCYSAMFRDCKSLTQAPELPATTLTEYCYSNMFENCSGLTRAPELPAPTLTTYCYNSMFRGCPKLNSVKCLATDISASDCTKDWLYNAPTTGDFYTPASTAWLTDNDDGIPSGWTRHDI